MFLSVCIYIPLSLAEVLVLMVDWALENQSAIYISQAEHSAACSSRVRCRLKYNNYQRTSQEGRKSTLCKASVITSFLPCCGLALRSGRSPMTDPTHMPRLSNKFAYCSRYFPCGRNWAVSGNQSSCFGWRTWQLKYSERTNVLSLILKSSGITLCGWLGSKHQLTNLFLKEKRVAECLMVLGTLLQKRRGPMWEKEKKLWVLRLKRWSLIMRVSDLQWFKHESAGLVTHTALYAVLYLSVE